MEEIFNDYSFSPFKPVNKELLRYKDNILEYKTRIVDRNKSNESKKKSVMFDCYQQSFLISELLKNNYSITIYKMYKRGVYSLFKIKEIKKDNVILYNEKDFDYSNITDIRNKRKYMDNFVNNKMIQLLETINYRFKIKKNKISNKIILVNNDWMRRIKKIKINNKIFQKNDILRIGEITHKIIFNKVIFCEHVFNQILI